MNQRVISFRGSSGRIVELMRVKEGGSLTREDTGRIFYQQPGTDITVRGAIEPRRPKAPGKGLHPRESKLAYVSSMGSKARLNPDAPRADPLQLLRTGRSLGKLADRAGVDVAAQAGWYGPKPSKATGYVNRDAENRRLKSAYGAFNMKPDAARIKAELATGATLQERKVLGRLIQKSTPLLRRAKARG